jgi:hypothetical protein
MKEPCRICYNASIYTVHPCGCTVCNKCQHASYQRKGAVCPICNVPTPSEEIIVVCAAFGLRPTVVPSIAYLPEHFTNEPWLVVATINPQPLSVIETSILYHPGHPTKERLDIGGKSPHPMNITHLVQLALTTYVNRI